MGAAPIYFGFTINSDKLPISDMKKMLELMDKLHYNPDINGFIWDLSEFLSEEDSWKSDLFDCLTTYQAFAGADYNSLKNNSLDYIIDEGPLEFISVGGDSWGDEPFDGFSELKCAVDFLHYVPEAKALSNFIGKGVRTK